MTIADGTTSASHLKMLEVKKFPAIMPTGPCGFCSLSFRGAQGLSRIANS